jgi:hypothetical protein
VSDDLFGDAIWEAWRSGRNSDLVDADYLYSSRAEGLEPEECIAREMRRISPRRPDLDEEF